jgi:hypothetical protein
VTFQTYAAAFTTFILARAHRFFKITMEKFANVAD